MNHVNVWYDNDNIDFLITAWFNAFIGDSSEDYDSVKLHELVVEYLVFSGYKEAGLFKS